MEENETKDFGQLLGENLGITGEELQNLETGSNQRLNEAKIFDMQAGKALDEYQKRMQIDLEQQRLEFEKVKAADEALMRRNIEAERNKLEMEKYEKELAFKRAIEEYKLAIEEKKANSEIRALWAKVILAAVEVASGIGLGLLYLKVNLQYGGFVGKDGKRFWDAIRNIKIGS